jgi:hypothetical protein
MRQRRAAMLVAILAACGAEESDTPERNLTSAPQIQTDAVGDHALNCSFPCVEACCEAGDLCVAGFCQRRCGWGDEARSERESDCPENTICVASRCVPHEGACASDDECEKSHFCDLAVDVCLPRLVANPAPSVLLNLGSYWCIDWGGGPLFVRITNHGTAGISAGLPVAMYTYADDMTVPASTEVLATSDAVMPDEYTFIMFDAPLLNSYARSLYDFVPRLRYRIRWNDDGARLPLPSGDEDVPSDLVRDVYWCGCG